MRSLIKISIVALLAVLVGACQRTEDRYAKRHINADELIGEWVMTPETVEDLRRVGYGEVRNRASHTITIRHDGSCRFHTFASALNTDRKPNDVLDQPCQWSVRDIAGRQTLLIDLTGEPSFVVSYKFAEEDGQLLLWQHADDPDAWRYVDYVKRKSLGPEGRVVPDG